MSEIAVEIPRKPTLISRIKERFAKMKERLIQEKTGVEQAKANEATMSLSDKLKQRINRVVTTETSKRLRLDARVEAEWLKSYQRIYNALGEGKTKQIMDRLEPVFAVHAKTARALSYGIDKGLRAFSILSAVTGLINSGSGMTEPTKVGRAHYAHEAVDNFVNAGVAGVISAERFSVDSARIQGFVGEKVAGIVNKILHKPARAA